MVSSWFLSLMALSCCVCGLELNVAHTSYQAQEGQSLTLDWTFTPRPDPFLKDLSVRCYMFTISEELILLHFDDGVVHSEFQSEEFSGRVQFDRDLLREGRIRLHVSSLRTQDSGEYTCWVVLLEQRKSDRCWLNVTAARDQSPSKTGQEEPDSGSPGWIALYCGLGLTAVGLIVFYILKIHPHIKKLSDKFSETNSVKSFNSAQDGSIHRV